MCTVPGTGLNQSAVTQYVYSARALVVRKQAFFRS